MKDTSIGRSSTTALKDRETRVHGRASSSQLATRYATLSFNLEPLSSPTLSITHPLLLSQVDTVLKAVQELMDEVNGADEMVLERELPANWKDELDAVGVGLWNRSTTFKASLPDGEEHDIRYHVIFARFRLAAYKLISLGSVSLLANETQLSLLTLGTKTSEALLAAGETTEAEEVLKAGVDYAETLSNVDSSVPAVQKVLLSHYRARIEANIRAKNGPVGRWVMGKATALCVKEHIDGREVEMLAGIAYRAGAELISSSSTSSPQQDKRDLQKLDDGVNWLLSVTSLLESHNAAFAKDLQTLTLKKLSQAYLEMGSDQNGWGKAESTLSELLTLEPSTSLWRRFIKLLLRRGAGNGELIEAFTSATNSLNPWAESEGYALLAELSQLSGERRLLRFSILSSMLKVISSRHKALDPMDEPPTELGIGDVGFTSQILLAAFLTVTDEDHERIEALFNLVPQGSSIPPGPAFVCGTFLWNQGDKLQREAKFEPASRWYLLATHRALTSIKTTTFAKSFRKSALCLAEIQQFDKAQAVLSRAVGQDAKTQFVRFYLAVLKRNQDEAIAALTSLVQSQGFSLDILLWSGRCAQESGMKPIIVAVLEQVLGVSRTTAIPVVDQMVLLRCLIRLATKILEESDTQDQEQLGTLLHSHLRKSFELATSLAPESDKPANDKGLLKNVEWLHKTAYNLCIRFRDSWSPAVLADLFSMAASLIMLALRLSEEVDLDALSKQWFCQLSALSIRVANQTAHEESRASLLQIDSLRTAFRDSFTTHPTLPRGLELACCIVSLEMEILVALADWQGIEKLLDQDTFKTDSMLPAKIFKTIAKAALASPECPEEFVCKILKQTVSILFSRKDLNPTSLATWLRAIVKSLLGSGVVDEAFEYTRKAAQIVETHATYSSDEALWLISTSWEQGLSFFYSQSSEKGRDWCQLSVSIAQHIKSELEPQLVSNLTQLLERFPLSPCQ